MNQLVILAVLVAFCFDAAFSERRSTKDFQPELRSPQGMECQSGDGSSYRGSVSVSVSRKRCLNWNILENLWGDSKGLGNHNNCRNPNKSLMPWCRVKKGRRIIREFCNIPKCSVPTERPEPATDTELTCGERSEQRHKIVGGSFTPIESHPWVAALFLREGRFLCGATLITPCWVVTAAHCIFEIEQEDIQHMSVYLGKTAINETDVDKEQKFSVERVIVHENFNANIYDNDIALLKIKSKDGGCVRKTESARTVCLPPPHIKLPAGFQCSIAGFGMERYMAFHNSQYLKQGEVKLISQADCKSESYYGDLITKNMLCAGSPDWSTDACQNDSGGPLVCDVSGRVFLFGVVSWGDGCAKKNKPGVYTQVTNYNKWIATKTNLNKYTKGLMYPQK